MGYLRDVRSRVSFKQVGIFAAIMALLAQPLALLSLNSTAYAAPESLYSNAGMTVSSGAAFNSGVLDLTRYGNLHLTFGYDKYELDNGDSFVYGWSDGTEHALGTVAGVNGDDPAAVPVDVALPVAASKPGVSLYAKVVLSAGSDTVPLTSITLTGEATNATLSTTSASTATVKQTNNFSTSIDELVDTNEMVRVKVTADPTQTANVHLKYLEQNPASPDFGTYQPLTFSGGVAYFGGSLGFPLMDATTPMSVMYTQPGTYNSTTEIIRISDGSRIGSPLTTTTVVSYWPVPTAGPQSTQTVRESDFATSGWGFFNDTNNTATTTFSSDYEYALDPAAAKDTLKFSHPTDKMNLATLQYAGLSLRDIAEIGYDSYNQSGQGTYIQFNIDFNGSGTWQNRLTYVPASTAGTWQSNEGVQSGEGMWQWSGNLTGTTPWPDGVVASTRTWNDIVASFPDARIAPSLLGGLFIRSEPGSVNYVNNVYVATNSSNVTYNFMDDAYGPDLTVTTPAAGSTIRAPGGAYTLAGTVSDTGVGLDRIRVQIKDLTNNIQVLTPVSVTNYSGNNWTFDVPAGTFVDGNEYRISATAYDTWNNPTVVRRDVVIDNTAPTGILSQSGNSASVTVTLGGLSEPIQTPSGWTQSGSSYTVTHTTNGSYSVVLTDMVGNTTTLNYSVTTIDDQAPVINITNVTRNNDGTYTITGSANENLSGVQVSINGDSSLAGVVAGAIWSFTTEVLVDGIYTVDVTATDGVGNPALIMGYEFTAVTPFTPVTQPVVSQADFIVDTGVNNGNSSTVKRTTYVADVNTGAEEDTEGAILGAKTTKTVAKTPAAAIEPSEEGWKVWGLAWYWWVAIVGALGAAGWAGLSWFRGRGQA